MSPPYTNLSHYTGSINLGSYLNEVDIPLIYNSENPDIWFGISPNDIMEIGAYSIDDQTLLNWGTVGRDKQLQTVTLTYLDNLNNVNQYSYNEIVTPFTIYKNQSILLNPSDDLSSIGVTGGSYIVSYNFTREMAGTMLAPLIVKEISNTRTEIKLIPRGQPDNRYDSFCIKKFPIKDVAPVLLSISKGLPYDKIYKEMVSLSKYKNGIEFLKFMFFLSNDGDVINFLRNLYEDYIKYTFLTPSQATNNTEPTTIKRIQGIRTYYNNFLLQSYELVTDFNGIENRFISFVNLRLQERFGQFSNLAEEGYKNARQFCYDFFVVYFYEDAVHSLQSSYEDKYFGYLKNVLNFGNNKYFSILDHNFLDERQSPSDPITLIVKLQYPLPTDISIKNNCWISNFGMTPYTFTALVQNPVKYRTVKISGPNFSSPQTFINKEQTNTLYSSDDLNSEMTSDIVSVNKRIAQLNTDYSDFSNFVVFSTAQSRLDIFKNKMILWTNATESLKELERRYNLSLSSSIPYPYYSVEKADFTAQATEIINSFDDYEAYLFNGGSYTYAVSSGSFLSSSYVSEKDIEAQDYDKNNKDNLISNIPQYLIDDQNSSEYLTFLSMIGNHFDNIYTYLSALPIERQVRNELTSSIPVNTLKEMLYSFGWSVEDIIGSLDIDEVYLNSMNSASYNALSGQQRLQTIWNRILVNLSGIYKTKGTEECVNYLMACYGLPSSMIAVREYGGTDFGDDSLPTYKLDEKTYMLQFSGVTDYVEGPIPNSVRTVEFKFSIDNVKQTGSYYQDFRFVPLFTSIPYPYSDTVHFNWSIGVYKVPGQYTGKVVFQLGSGSSGVAITSSVLPIFNGDIFSVMLRRNLPFGLFEPNLDPSVIPLEYDLYVQRNENGRRIFYSTSSVILYDDNNDVFSQFGRFRLTNGTFKGSVDKLSIWDIPIDNNDFEEHVNDLNSYGYSGSSAYKNLWVRLNWDYPQNMWSEFSNSMWIDNKSPYYYIQNYYTDETLTTVDSTLFSAASNVIIERWQTYYPTGSVEIRAYNFPEAIGSAFSASWQNYQPCQWISHSIYPYHFKELTYQQDMDASKYGPNKYKNKKIRHVDYQINARFDSNNRSTSEPGLSISGESNQLGFFIDPQDSKNKDILRYTGRNGIMDLIGDPSNMYSDKYYGLVNKNVEYNLEGDKRTHFNELLTVYKFYFDKSIFQAIKNVLPARANAYTGVVIEPTLLERPKYQNKQILSNAQVSYEEPTIINQIYTFDEQLVWADFNTDWSLLSTDLLPPGSSSFNTQSNAYDLFSTLDTYEKVLNWYQTVPDVNISNINKDSVLLQTLSQRSMSNSQPHNYQQVIDLKYLTYPNADWPVNLPCGAYLNDYMDRIQHDFYPDFEGLPRLWESYTTPIYGSVTMMDGPNTLIDHLVIGPDHGVFDPTTYYPGSNSGNHQIIYYMLKVWDRYYYYAKSGNYVRSTNPLENTYDSASVYLYKYIIVDERFMRALIYFTDLASGPLFGASDITYDYWGGYYRHKASTFINTPGQNFSNVKAKQPTTINKTIFDIYMASGSMYFELGSGYPRNHYTHKLQQFSKWKFGDYTFKIFVKGRNTVDDTINESGINDGSLPIWSSNTSNINVINTSNILRTVPTIIAGQIVPSGATTTVSATTTPTQPNPPVVITHPIHNESVRR